MATSQAPESKNSLPVPTMGASASVAAAGETSSSAIAARERAAVEARFLVAMHRPRVFDLARAKLLTACQRLAFAKVARYAKPIGGGKVHGLSIRFAEEAANLWGNMDVSSFLVFDDEERRIYRTVGTDLETNSTHAVDIMVEKFVERRVVRDGMEVIGQRQNTQGQIVYRIRATEDDLLVKVNNFISKSRRNVILPLIPADIRDECEKQIIETVASGDARDPEGARKDIVLAFHVLGVDATALVNLLGHPLEQANPAELTLLRSYYTALKDGEATWTEIAEAHGTQSKTSTSTPPTPPKSGTDGLREGLTKKAGVGAKAESNKDAEASNACSECGGKDGQHRSTCKYFAD